MKYDIFDCYDFRRNIPPRKGIALINKHIKALKRMPFVYLDDFTPWEDMRDYLRYRLDTDGTPRGGLTFEAFNHSCRYGWTRKYIRDARKW